MRMDWRPPRTRVSHTFEAVTEQRTAEQADHQLFHSQGQGPNLKDSVLPFTEVQSRARCRL